MTRLPPRSPWVHDAPFGDGLVLLDASAPRVHRLSASAALVWEACDGETTVDELVDAIVGATGAAATTVAGDVEALLAALRRDGLVAGTGTRRPAERPLRDEAPGRFSSPPFAVHDERVVLRSDDPALASLADGVLASLVTTGPPTTSIAVSPAGDGIRVASRGFDASFAGEDEASAAIVGLVNRVAAATPAGLVLHAGAVQHPSGATVVLPATSGAGKSTLTAALVAAGCRYLTDEAVLVRPDGCLVAYPKPLALDATSRRLLRLGDPLALLAPDLVAPAALGGMAGPTEVLPAPALVVLPRHAPGEGVGGADLGPPLGPDDLLVAVAPHALNLAVAAAVGLSALTVLAASASGRTLVHDDLEAAVAVVLCAL